LYLLQPKFKNITKLYNTRSSTTAKLEPIALFVRLLLSTQQSDNQGSPSSGGCPVHSDEGFGGTRTSPKKDKQYKPQTTNVQQD
jgi:hypothetical protein